VQVAYKVGYATDRQMDGRTKATLIAPFPMVGGIIIKEASVSDFFAQDS